ncbi:MAG: hypothetical protein HOE19_04600 [Candidatus Komeilibacteria bacterium]|jgi:hypothetical protein|nr:hypothetical protein [Candidatus Komeilibacteria bacterium]MBT4447951.1 hypothetical protein [Candidatus Komeilibacteria bacterium]
MRKDKKEIEFEQPSELLLLANRYIMFIIAFIVLAILFSSYFFILRPKIDSISSANLENTEELDRKVKNELLLTKLEQLEAEYKDIMNNRQEDLDLLKKIVPYTPQTAELFVISDQLAKKHDFQLLNISISESAPKRATGNRLVTDTSNLTDEAAAAQLDEEFFNEEPAVVSVDDVLATTGIKSTIVDLSVSKTISEDDEIVGADVYTQFKNYISELENSIRLLDIQTIGFAEIAAEGEASYIFNLDLITYYQ